MLRGHNDFVFSIVFSPQGKTLISGSGDKTIKIWNLDSETHIKELN